MYKKSLFIFRRDLRLEDNIGLFESLENSTEVIPCFIYDENLIRNLKDSKFRWNFLNESLTDLDKELKKKGTKSIVIVDNMIPHEKRFFDEAFTKYFLKNTDAYIVMSKSVEKELLQRKPDAKYFFHPHPIYEHLNKNLPNHRML